MEGAIPFSGLLHLNLDTYLLMLSVKQRENKYLFLSLWYDWPEIEPRSLGPSANTVSIIPMGR